MVYAIDVHWDAAKCFRVEAKSREEAEAVVKKRMVELISQPCGEVDPLNEGFEMMEDYELSYAGEGETAETIEYC